jgi:hypothetical protein
MPGDVCGETYEVEDVDELYARLTPMLAEVLFDGDKTGIMEWLEDSEDDWEAYESD